MFSAFSFSLEHTARGTRNTISIRAPEHHSTQGSQMGYSCLTIATEIHSVKSLQEN